MLQWYQRLKPRQGAFFPLFQRHAAVTIAAARSLREMLSGGDQLKLHCRRSSPGTEADGIAREVYQPARRLHHAFDRADIQSLITQWTTQSTR